MADQISLSRTVGRIFYDLIGRAEHRFQSYNAPFSERRMVLVAGDLLLLGAVTRGLERSIYPEGLLATVSLNTLILGLLTCWLVCAWFVDLYDIPSSYSRSMTTLRISGVGVILAAASFLLITLTTAPLSSYYSIPVLFLGLAGVWLWRNAYISLSSLFPIPNRVLIVGAGEQAHRISQVLKSARALNYRVEGYVANGRETFQSEKGGPPSPLLGNFNDIPRLAQTKRIHEIVVTTGMGTQEDLYRALVECQARGIRVTSMPTLYAKLKRRIPVRDINLDWALHSIEDRALFERFQLAFKRLLDLTLVLGAAPFLVVLFPLVALAIRLDSPGPVFYRQTRLGRAGIPFSIWKFRTMVQNAERNGQAQWAQQGDARVTRIGRFLRKSRMDELPQILNILAGEMSFIGPRPERPEFVEELERQIPFYRTRLMVKPGLTGWAQVHYDYGNTIEDAQRKLEYDFYYIRFWTFWLDLYILFRTVSVVARLKGL